MPVVIFMFVAFTAMVPMKFMMFPKIVSAESVKLMMLFVSAARKFMMPFVKLQMLVFSFSTVGKRVVAEIAIITVRAVIVSATPPIITVRGVIVFSTPAIITATICTAEKHQRNEQQDRQNNVSKLHPVSSPSLLAYQAFL